MSIYAPETSWNKQKNSQDYLVPRYSGAKELRQGNSLRWPHVWPHLDSHREITSKMALALCDTVIGHSSPETSLEMIQIPKERPCNSPGQYNRANHDGMDACKPYLRANENRGADSSFCTFLVVGLDEIEQGSRRADQFI